MSAENLQPLRPSVALAAALAPGILLSALVAAIGYIAAPFVAKAVPIPNMVIALVVGIALNPLAARPAVQPGMNFCVKTLLRWAVALLGLRVALGDIAALGLQTAVLIVIAMAATVVSGFVFARWYGRSDGYRRAGRCRHGSMRGFGDARDLDGRAGVQGQGGRHCVCRGRGECARHACDAGLPAALHRARL